MKLYVFYACIGLSVVFATVAFFPLSENAKSKQTESPSSPWWSKQRIILFFVSVLSLSFIFIKMVFSVFPALEAKMMPVEIYPVIQREFWLPFTILFFASMTHLVPTRNRRAMVIAIILLIGVVFQQTIWRLVEPEIYAYHCTMTDGVCKQSSFDTCGPASLVTFLTAIGIEAEEGEMARLCMAAPKRGITPHQAAYGLKEKFKQEGRSERVKILAPDFRDLHELSEPMIAGIKFGKWTNHMVCIFAADKEGLTVGDPISTGRKHWTWEYFSKAWSGIVLVAY